MIIEGDCVEQMRQMDEASVDAIVTDPPYGLHFMGKSWDQFGGPTGRDNTTHSERGGAMHAGKYDFTRNHEFQREMTSWAVECLRVLKPGGYLLAFGGTRTYHRLVCAIEDAGFEIRDSLIWLYGSGFPKSLDVSKAIDKAAGAEREITGVNPNGGRSADAETSFGQVRSMLGREALTTAPATPEAAQWEGWGTALKPGHEPIVVARKPLVGTVAQNVLEHGTGALNIDGCRIEGAKPHREVVNTQENEWDGDGPWKSSGVGEGTSSEGRWPANAVLSHLPECEQVGTRRAKGSAPASGPTLSATESVAHGDYSGERDEVPSYQDQEVPAYSCASGCPVSALDEQSGERKSPEPYQRGAETKRNLFDGGKGDGPAENNYGDSGGASRFFYTAKASRGERNAGLEGDLWICPTCRSRDPEICAWLDPSHKHKGDMCCPDRFHRVFPEVEINSDDAPAPMTGTHGQTGKPNKPIRSRNHHPTVKPIALMRWLVRLVCPVGGTVLDPFAGSGTTGIAAVLEGFDFIGIEREAEYCEIARARLAWWSEQKGETEEILARAGLSERLQKKHRDAGQIGLLD